MLKNVVLPAPLGPMIETIERGATANEMSLTATRPPNALVTRSVASSGAVRVASGGSARGSASLMRAPRTRTPRVAPSVSSIWRLRSGMSPSGRRTIISTSMKPKIPKATSLKVKLSPRSFLRSLTTPWSSTSGIRRLFTNVSATAPITTPQMLPEAAEDHHRQDEDRESELELVRVDAVQVGAVEGAGDAADRAAGGVGGELGLHQRHAHARRGHLVLAQRDPGPPEPRVAQAEVHEQHHQARSPASSSRRAAG